MTSISDRFWAKVVKKGPDECWEWTAFRDRDGYGMFGLDGGARRANRVSWMLSKGPIKDGLQVLHRCIGNRACVNPRHLYLGTPADNCLDRHRQGRQANGNASGRAKLTEDDVRAIRKTYKRGKTTQRALAAQYGVNSVNAIVNNTAWKHVV